MPYVTEETLAAALTDLKANADHLLKIWLTLKEMGMSSGNPVEIDTGNSTDALRRLFGYGDPEGKFYVPFAHTRRFLTMKGDASRSVIQTTLKRWAESGSVVTVDPTSYLDIEETAYGSLRIQPGRAYPEGLGHSKNGFALEENARVTIPLLAFGVWYYRQEELPEGANWPADLRDRLKEDLSLSSAEIPFIFTDEPTDWEIMLQNRPLSDREVRRVVEAAIEGDAERRYLVQETLEEHTARVRSMVTPSGGRPAWTVGDPEDLLRQVLEGGSKAILLYGPPRTGKTRQALRLLEGRNGERIQIHDGWGYDELMVGLRPLPAGGWDYEPGPLLQAIRAEKEYVVLEEINRTDFSQAIGEVFSLIEEPYRGSEHEIRLRNGDNFSIPKETVIVCTMNTLDRSTENVDDALFGRMDAIEVPPRVETLGEILEERQVTDSEKWRELFVFLQDYHPIGHGYFAPLSASSTPLEFYRTRLRPVLQKHLAGYRDDELAAIDEMVDQLFGR